MTGGFCIHCNKLQDKHLDKHLEVIKKIDLKPDPKVTINTIVEPDFPDEIIQNSWVLVEESF